MAEVFLLTGSNQGYKDEHLAKAREELGAIMNLQKVSRIYTSEAWGLTDQPDFYNQVIIANTEDSPTTLLRRILDVELSMGRVRQVKWGQRLIDIDILYYDDMVLNLPELIVPHPFIQERRFTLMPLAELVPGKAHPIFRKTQAQLLEYCKDPLNVTLIS